MNYLFLKLSEHKKFALKLQGKCWKNDVVLFTAHLSVTIKLLTRYKQKVVLASMLEGKSVPSTLAANTNQTTLLKDQSAIKCLPLTRFLSNFGCKIIFMFSVNIWHQQNSKELLVTWPLSANGLLSNHGANLESRDATLIFIGAFVGGQPWTGKYNYWKGSK